MKAAHLDDVCKLENACFAHPWSRQSLQESLENENSVFYVATENDEVIAEIEMAWTESKIAYLTEDQMEYEEILADKGWTIINNDTAVSKDMFGGVN